MKNRTLLTSTITLAVAAAGFTACGGDDEPGSAAAAKATATPSSPAFGVYSREVTEDDLDRTMRDRNDAPGFEPSPTGRYQLTLAPGEGIDLVKVTGPDGLTIEMDAKVDGPELRLVSYAAPERGAFCDQAIAAQAKYTLTVRDDALSLAPTQDECADRDSVLTGTWEKG